MLLSLLSSSFVNISYYLLYTHTHKHTHTISLSYTHNKRPIIKLGLRMCPKTKKEANKDTLLVTMLLNLHGYLWNVEFNMEEFTNELYIILLIETWSMKLKGIKVWPTIMYTPWYRQKVCDDKEGKEGRHTWFRGNWRNMYRSQKTMDINSTYVLK